MSEDEIGALIHELESLKLRESRIIALLKAANEERNAVRPVVPAAVANATGFARGDRVRILNRFRRPADWPSNLEWDERSARTATVTRVTVAPLRVYFLTDNGIETWRKPDNLNHHE